MLADGTKVETVPLEIAYSLTTDVQLIDCPECGNHPIIALMNGDEITAAGSIEPNEMADLGIDMIVASYDLSYLGPSDYEIEDFQNRIVAVVDNFDDYVHGDRALALADMTSPSEGA